MSTNGVFDAQVTRPIAGAAPMVAGMFDLAARGYKEEFFLSGNAVAYDGDPSGDAAPDRSFLQRQIIRSGTAWVGVSVQKVGIDGGGFVPAGPYLKNIDRARYGELVHPGDEYSFDMFTQAGRAVRGDAEVAGTAHGDGYLFASPLGAPTSRLSGVGGGGAGFVFLFGVTDTWDAARAAQLYPGGKVEYLERMRASLAAAVASGFVLADDQPEIDALLDASYPSA